MDISEKIPLNVYFEIGKTKKRIDDLLSITKGTLYRLEDSERNVVRIMLENEEIGKGRILTKNGRMYVEVMSLKDE
ncbi:flagellar motor switch protein FliN [Ectobacillus antri]|jgi:flagellar motor switch protein FliN/FliY|uniref:Flagellar motor switch protein FliN n=1 Tax=Ectobacillus antri TaxID=2486280 RepID=A0ABT6H2N5_9BACI|nr:flagellar motor switch protein FliN [Ectobacillus antri]MDG4656210.1 flagellar motor switch protein FliN [Ectobacillus antri]MDG5752885.1 flagellar motor switch protein FliN [Ectobacillus antri]